MIYDLNKKPSNPKDALGTAKIPYHVWPNTATLLGVMGMLEGSVKYGRSNYRAVGVRASIYYDAARRHLDSWFEGENNTKDHNIHHLGNALACIAIIVDAEAKGILIDDRMYPGGFLSLRDKLTPEVMRIKNMYKGKTPHHYSLLDILGAKGGSKRQSKSAKSTKRSKRSKR
jgi:hypothetical protein